MTEKKIEEALEEPKGIPEDVAADLMKIENRIQRDIAIKEASKRLGASIGAIKAELERRDKEAEQRQRQGFRIQRGKDRQCAVSR